MSKVGGGGGLGQSMPRNAHTFATSRFTRPLRANTHPSLLSQNDTSPIIGFAIMSSLDGRPRLKHVWRSWHRYALPVVVRYPRNCWPFTPHSPPCSGPSICICRHVATTQVTSVAQMALSVARLGRRFGSLILFVGRVIRRVFARYLDSEYIVHQQYRV